MSEPPFDFDSVLEESQQSATDSGGRMPMDDLLGDGLRKFVEEDDPVLALRLWMKLFDAHAMSGSKKIKLYLSQYVGLIDQLVSDQLNIILHSDKFQSLESRWRGVEKLIATASDYGN
ncbi:MAG: type VI secretion system protein ImpD, partial [Oceanicoccus sp.]